MRDTGEESRGTHCRTSSTCFPRLNDRSTKHRRTRHRIGAGERTRRAASRNRDSRERGSGRGSTFTVRLPLLMTEPLQLEHPEGEDRSLTETKRRILVVDDNPDAGKSLALMLTLMGNSVQTRIPAGTQSPLPTVVSGDRPDGCRDAGPGWLRNDSVHPRAAWGAGHGHPGPDRLGAGVGSIQSREAGCNGHLVKPVGYRDLEKVLSEIASGRRG